jgi:WD40 repeat protein/subtilisin-like proprotein convertase family protein
MPSVTEPAEFFVVGGPVQPDRPCYVERAADRLLEGALRAKRLACVLGPRAIGKTSLLLRAAQTLRGSGWRVAIVDLRRLAEIDVADTDGRLKAVAEGIAAELALGIDVGAWWQRRESRIGESKLVEFFWEIVLTNTTAPIAVMFDDLDAAWSWSAELLAAIEGCHARRSRESDFARLSFVLAGCVAQARLAAQGALTDMECIEPKDLSLSEAYRLAVAFGAERELANPLMDRVFAWTAGHPYLTQKVSRGVVRKGGRLEDVERLVREQLLARSAAEADPLLTQIRAWLAEPSRQARQAARLLRKIAGGSKVALPKDAMVAEHLLLSGAVRVDQNGRLQCRNRVIKELAIAHWIKAAASGGRFALAAVVLLAVLAAGGYWYMRYLPEADIATLSSPSATLTETEEAYRRLRALPGFAARAEALWSEALARQGRAAGTTEAAAAVDTRLRELPGQDAAADLLLGDFWLRRARAAADAERRDEALLLARRAAALPSADPTAGAYLAELVGDDYLYLERSLRLPSVPGSWHMAFDAATLLWFDAEQQAVRTPFGPASAAAPDAVPVELTALQHASLVRELAVTGDGTAGELELSLTVQHAAAAELRVTLTGPSGSAAAVDVPPGDGIAVETVQFRAMQGSPLADLADEPAQGVWRLTIVDRAAGNTGVLFGWTLTHGSDVARDDPPEALPIPDPVRVDAVQLRRVGERAAVWPAAPGAIGTVALWNLSTGALDHDFTLPAPPRDVAINVTGTRMLAATDRELRLWNVADGALVARVATQTQFVLPPIFSSDGAYVAIAERVDAANPLYSVLRSNDASLVATLEGAPDVLQWQLGPGASWLALLGPERVLRVLETRGGTEVANLPHERPIERVFPVAAGAAIATIDSAGAVVAWSLGAAAAPPRELGTTVSASSVSVSSDGQRLALARGDGAVAVIDVVTGSTIYRLRQSRSDEVTLTQLSPDGTELVTQAGVMLRSWKLPAVSAATLASATAPTAIGFDRSTDLVAIGLRTGELQFVPAPALRTSPTSLAFFGHRGPITAVALDASRGLAATGGNDGIVRLWDVAAQAPTGAVMQPTSTPISLVALSSDGRFVANAAGRVVRVANVTDGAVIAEITLQGAARALTFAPGAASVVIGDDTGTVTIAPFAPARARVSAAFDAAVTAVAFAPDGARLAVGDAAGVVRLIVPADGVQTAATAGWPQPVRWLDFSPDGAVLLAATDAWLHALSVTATALEPLHTKLVQLPAAPRAAAAVSTSVVRVVGLDSSRALGVVDLDLAATAASNRSYSSLVVKDWAAALALQLDDNGDPVRFDP